MAQKTAYVHKGLDAEVGAFGCNGASAQEAYELPAAADDPTTTQALVNAIRLALIANGIAVEAPEE